MLEAGAVAVIQSDVLFMVPLELEAAPSQEICVCVCWGGGVLVYESSLVLTPFYDDLQTP